MPCNCDYMEPSTHEVRSKETAELLVYAFDKLDKPIEDYIKKAAASSYGNTGKLNEMVVLLCSTIRSMDEIAFNTIVYNPKDKLSRKLADWWEEHEEADRKRIAKEEQQKKSKEEKEYKNYLRLKEKYEGK